MGGRLMTEPLDKAAVLDHVRRPDLPWRAATRTECGKPIADVKQIIDRDELLARLQSHGKARTSMTVCMTCWQTAARWETFEQDPVAAMAREVYGGRRDPQFAMDLRALAALAVAHRDEFDEYVAGLATTASLAARRAQRARQHGRRA
jgi:hypothetical protein